MRAFVRLCVCVLVCVCMCLSSMNEGVRVENEWRLVCTNQRTYAYICRVNKKSPASPIPWSCCESFIPPGVLCLSVPRFGAHTTSKRKAHGR